MRQLVVVLILAFVCIDISYTQSPTVLWSFDTKDMSFGVTSAADIDNDGKLELVFSTYRNDEFLYAVNAEDGSLLWKFDVGGCSDAAPLIIDVDGDNNLDVILHSSCLGYMFCLNGIDGTLKWEVVSRGTDSPPSAADVDFDGEIDFFDGDFRGWVSRFKADDGSVVWETKPADGFFLQTAPVLADINGDDTLEIIVATWNLDSLCNVYALNSIDGSIIWQSAENTMSIYHGPVVADVDRDQLSDVLVSDFMGTLHCINGQTGTTKWTYKFPGSSYSAAPVTVADVDNDGHYEIIYFPSDAVCAVSGSGQLKWYLRMIKGQYNFRGGITVDVNEDSFLDIVFGTNKGELTAVSGKDGALIWNMDFEQIYGDTFDLQHGPVAADFDGDGSLDIFFVGGKTNYPDYENNYGRAYAISTGRPGGPEWLMFRNNEKRNAVLPIVVTNVKDNDGISDIEISPNPATKYIEIKINSVILSEAKDPVVLVFDVLGIEHPATSWHPSAEGNVRIDVSALPKGVYFIKVGNQVSKFVKM